MGGAIPSVEFYENSRYEIAAWVMESNSLALLQATGGWLKSR